MNNRGTMAQPTPTARADQRTAAKTKSGRRPSPTDASVDRGVRDRVQRAAIDDAHGPA
jgi:hypothetical protein